MIFTLVQTVYPALIRRKTKRAPRSAWSVAFIVRVKNHTYRALLWDASDDRFAWARDGIYGGVDHWSTKAQAARAAINAVGSPFGIVSRAEANKLRAELIRQTDTGCGAPAKRVTA